MRIWGKIIGGFFGFLLGGPIGLIIGIFIGHLFDRGLSIQSFNTSANSEAQAAFFNATFLVMGHIAKADGRVSEAEINAARSIMNRMGLNEEQRQRAIRLFEEGKQPQFNLEQTLTHLSQACHGSRVLLRMFVEIQSQNALADGHLSPAKQQILQTICRYLGFAPLNFAFFEDFFGGFQRGYQQQHQHYQRGNSHSQLQEAYQTLEVPQTATLPEIKKSYRKLMSQHHPDKLMAKGLPEGMVKLATEKTQKIQAAYEKICAARGNS